MKSKKFLKAFTAGLCGLGVLAMPFWTTGCDSVQLDDLNAKIETLTEEKTAQATEISTLKNQKSTLEAQLEILRNSNSAKQEEIDALENQITELQNRINAMHMHSSSNSYAEYYVRGNEAFKRTICSDCNGKVSETKLDAKEVIIVYPGQEQTIVDESDINGKTLVFAPGVYGNIILRPTKETVEHIYQGSDKTVEIKMDNLDNDGIYGYEREFKDITFAGTEGAYFSGVLMAQSDVMAQEIVPTQTQLGITKYDPNNKTGDTDKVYDVIRDVYCTSSNRYITYMPMDGITFENMDFITEFGRIYVRNLTENDGIKNITISNCSFVTNIPYKQPTGTGLKDSEMYIGAVTFVNGSSRELRDRKIYTATKQHTFENVVIKHSYIYGHNTGFGVQNFKNVTIKNNIVVNVREQAFYVQSIAEMAVGSNSENSGWLTGDVLIENNVMFKDEGSYEERAIRFGGLKDAHIVIRNNTFVNCVDPENELFKSQAVVDGEGEETTIEFTGNTYDGEALTDVSWTGSEWTTYGRVYAIESEEPVE